MSFGSNISFNNASAIKGWLRTWFFIPLLNSIMATLNQLTINNRFKSTENKYWKQMLYANVVKMTDESCSDCTNSACATDLAMIIFHSLLQILWPSFAFCGIKKKNRVWVIYSWQRWHSPPEAGVFLQQPWQVFFRNKVFANKKNKRYDTVTVVKRVKIHTIPVACFGFTL